mmetsp:Transcript_67869/g.148991  ORF Transcript_67869/g.148991 Transcript_67869/m.148991 type:complete len:218 (+) Transcript_67869:484-1137(+)
MRFLLCARQPQGLAFTTIRELLLELHQQPRAVAWAKLQNHNVHHSHQLLMLLRIQHEPAGASFHLLGQLFNAFGLADAKLVGIDVVLYQGLAEHRQIHKVLLRGGGQILEVREFVLLGLVLRPPLIGGLTTLHNLVRHHEFLVLVILQLLLGDVPLAHVGLPVHALDQLLSTFLDAIVDTGLRHAISIAIARLFNWLVSNVHGLAKLASNPFVAHDL